MRRGETPFAPNGSGGGKESPASISSKSSAVTSTLIPPKPGDPLDWTKIIGPGLFLENKPACPVHGESAYTYSPVILEPGTLAAPCKDPKHRPADTKDW